MLFKVQKEILQLELRLQKTKRNLLLNRPSGSRPTAEQLTSSGCGTLHGYSVHYRRHYLSDTTVTNVVKKIRNSMPVPGAALPCCHQWLPVFRLSGAPVSMKNIFL